MKSGTSCFIAGLALALTACQPPRKVEELPPPKASGDSVILQAQAQRTALSVEPVGAQQPSFTTFTGRLSWDDDATARIFTPFAGIVRQLLVDVNEPVSKGAALATIQSADFGQMQADVKKAVSDYRRAQQSLNRTRELLEHGAAARKDLESAEADFASASAEKERAETRYAIYKANAVAGSTGQDFLLPSPLSGVLVERNVTPGQEVRPDQMLANLPQLAAPLFTITDPKLLWIWLDVTETQLPLIHKGQDLVVRSKAFPDRSFKGKLDFIGSSLDPTTRMIRARGTIDNADELLKAELYVSVEIPEAAVSSATVQIPSKAVFLRDNHYFVFLETGEGHYERREVELGPERDGKVTIISGLKEGQKLVTEGSLLLQSVIDNAPKS